MSPIRPNKLPKIVARKTSENVKNNDSKCRPDKKLLFSVNLNLFVGIWELENLSNIHLRC